MKSEPIETHDPNLTAFALGELSPAELFQFEQQLKESPKAQADLADIEETIDWLRDGFSTELQAPQLMIAPVAPSDEEKIVAGNFKRPGMKTMLSGLAAVVAAVVAVGALITEDRAAFQKNQVMAKASAPQVETVQPVNVSAALAESTTTVPELHLTPPANGTILAGYGTPNEPSDYFKLPDDVQSAVSAGQTKIGLTGLAELGNLDDTSLFPTPIMEINSASIASGAALPGIEDIGKGQASFGKYRFQNEESKNLSDEEFGHGQLAFEIRSRIVEGKLIETVRLVDTRTTPDGKESKTVKEFVREGADIGKPIHSLLPEALQSPTTKNVQPTSATVAAKTASIPTLGAVTPAQKNPLMTEFFQLNAELSAVRDSLAKNPTSTALKTLENKLSDLIKRQETLGQKMEIGLGAQ